MKQVQVSELLFEHNEIFCSRKEGGPLQNEALMM
jgi:hypothetical protein